MKHWSWPLALLVLAFPVQLFARQLVIGLGIPREHMLWPKFQGFMDAVAATADKDLHIELKSTPFLRIQEQVNKGELDGDLGRLQEAYEGSINVVRVDEVASTLQLLFIFRKDQVMNDLESIRQSPTLASKDILFHKRACKELKLNCEFVGAGSKSMEMLRLKRAGSVITTQYQLGEYLRLAGDATLFGLGAKTWYKEPAYLFLAKKNADLAPRLASALKELKQDGTFKKFFGMNP